MNDVLKAENEDLTPAESKHASSREYSVHELARLSGVSVRTLHYYDEVGLLRPTRRDNRYRNYGAEEVERLQQILLYREIGFKLKAIKDMLDDPKFEVETALREHLQTLQAQQRKIETLISSVQKTLESKERETDMSDEIRFEGFKQNLIDENEQRYGKEAREKYGDGEVDASNAKLMGLSQEQFAQLQRVETEMYAYLNRAMSVNDPRGEDALRACELHRDWLNNFWKEGTYSKEAHLGLAETYAADERFKEYYDKNAPGTTDFLVSALRAYCS